MRHTDTALTVDDTSVAAVMDAMTDPEDFTVTDFTDVREVLNATLDTLGWRVFTEIELWAVADTQVLVTVDPEPGMRLASESLSVTDTFATAEASDGAGAVRHVLNQLLDMHRTLISNLYDRHPDSPVGPAPQLLASVVDYLWAVGTDDNLRQDDRDRPGHVSHAVRELARWLDIATVSVRYRLPTHLRQSLRPGYTSEHVAEVLSELNECSRLRLICVWDHHDLTIGYHGNPTVYVQSIYQLYQPCYRLLSWLGAIENPQIPPPDGPGMPAAWIGDIATDIDIAQYPDIAADAHLSRSHHTGYTRVNYTRT
jgi:hypothetical protein